MYKVPGWGEIPGWGERRSSPAEGAHGAVRGGKAVQTG